MFDLARDIGLRPPLKLFGTPEFQRAAAEQARAMGIEVQPENDRVAFEHEAAIRAALEAASAAAARAEAEHEAEQQRRALEKSDEEDRIAEQRAEQRRRAPAPRPQPGEPA